MKTCESDRAPIPSRHRGFLITVAVPARARANSLWTSGAAAVGVPSGLVGGFGLVMSRQSASAKCA
jgi:hypothetical protein